MRDRYLDQVCSGKVADLPTEHRGRPSFGEEESVGYRRLEENSFEELPEEDFYLAGLPKVQCYLKAMPTTDCSPGICLGKELL